MLDAFAAYKIKAPRSNVAGEEISNSLPRGWNISVNDRHIDDADADDPENFSVSREKMLFNPAILGTQPSLFTPAIHYVRYKMKSSKESVQPAGPGGEFSEPARHIAREWQLQNSLGTITVASKKVSALLVPVHTNPASSPTAPGDATHFVCYTVKATRSISDQTPESSPGSGAGKFRRDLQLFLADDFDDCALDQAGSPSFAATAVQGKCLVDLKKAQELCNPIDKSAVVPPRETTAVITGSTAETSKGLLCYKATLAQKVTNQDAAVLAGTIVGTSINPKQSKHVQRGVNSLNPIHVTPGNLFPSPILLDSKKRSLVCVPTDILSVAPLP